MNQQPARDVTTPPSVQAAGGGPGAGPTVGPLPALPHLSARTLTAYVALWVVLSLMAEGSNTAGLAAAVAWTVFAAVFLAYGPAALEHAKLLAAKGGR